MHKVIEYFKEAKSELKKVTWPTRQQALNHTLLVIGISLGMAAFLGILDYLFTLGFEYIIGRWLRADFALTVAEIFRVSPRAVRNSLRI